MSNRAHTSAQSWTNCLEMNGELRGDPGLRGGPPGRCPSPASLRVFNLAGHVISFPDESLFSSDARWGLLSPRVMQLPIDRGSAL